MHGRDQAAVNEVAAMINGRGGQAIAVTGDLREFSQVEEIRRQVEAGAGPVDILIANAGGSLTPPVPLEEIPEDGWRATVDGNLLTTFLTLKSFLPGDEGAAPRLRHHHRLSGRTPGRPTLAHALRRRQGGDRAAYPAGGGAGRPFGIRVNCIAPETILTERNRERIPAGQQETLADWHPLKRLGTPDDVASAAAFLAGDGASWITGVVLDVAGGAVLV